MNCPDFLELIQRHLDGHPALEDAAAERHAAACADCRALASAAQSLLEGLRLEPVPVPPGGLPDRVVGQVLAERHRRRLVRRFAAGLALAASLAGVLPAARYALTPAPAVSETAEHAALVPAPPLPVDVGPVPSLQQSVEDAGLAVADLTRRTVAETVGPTRALFPAAATLDLRVPEETPLDAPARSLLEAGQGVSEGLEPVADSARRAVSLFLRDLPPMDVENNTR